MKPTLSLNMSCCASSLHNRWIEVINHNKIVDHIWLGNSTSGENVSFLKKNMIKCVINCTPRAAFANITSTQKYRIPIDDHPDVSKDMVVLYPMYAQAIHDFVSRGENVYVHCMAGMNRSATLLASYFIIYRGMLPMEAVRLIKDSRPLTFTSPYLYDVLEKIYAMFGESIDFSLLFG